MSAVRVARGFTNRNYIVKFEGCYHGHADHLLVAAGSGVATCGITSSAGVPDGFAQYTLVAPFNDKEAVERIFSEYGDRIAAVIVEPVPANMGVVPEKNGFLQYLRDITLRYEALLIFDEVITGFRLTLGGAQKYYGITPDLTTIGKIVGGGFPAAAFGGRKEIMSMLAPEGPVYQAGTLSGNPIAMTAGLATLSILSEKDIYNNLNAKAEKFIAELQKVVDLADTNEFVQKYPKMKSAESVGLYSGEPTYETYRSTYEGTRMKAKSDWLNSNMKGVPEINAAFKKKLDSLQALPLRGSMAPTSFEPVREKIVEGEDSSAAEIKAVKFKFGRDHERFDVAWEGTAKGMTAAELYALFTEHANEVSVFITIKQNKPVWIRKDGVITGRHHYRYSRIEFEYQGKNMVGLGDFSLPGYIVDEPEVQEWLNHYDADDIALQQNAAAEAKAKAVAAKEAAKNDTVYAKDAYMPEFTKMSIPRIIRDNTFGAVALIDSGMFRYRGSVVRMSPYAIMTTEMTQKLFDQTMLRQQDSTKRIKDRSTFKNPSKPVHNITWDDARAACKLLGGDLPTEAQWEFAGRADNNEGSIWDIDEDATVGDYAVYRENSYKRGKNSQDYGPQIVASKKPNAWGMYDMSGNVAEWTRDKYFMFSIWVESSNPTGAMMGYSKVYKGGSWKDKESMLNLTESDDEDPRYWSDAIGFRCVFPRKMFEGR